MEHNDERTFILEVTRFDGTLVGSHTMTRMGKENTFVDIIVYAYDDLDIDYQEPKEHHEEEQDFEVTVYKIDTLGRKRCIGEMDVCLEGDAELWEAVELAYHGCTDD